MKLFIVIFCAFLVDFVMSADPDVLSAMESYQIVPNVIDKAPKNLIEITYPSGVSVSLGNELTPTQVKDIPNLVWETESEDTLYTLLMTDPDAPSRSNPVLGEVRHWLVINIPGKNISEGKTLFEYRGSGPPLGTGLHRYVFLVFKQNETVSTTEKVVPMKSREGRLMTKTRELIEKYKLGDPVAGNFYQAQYDDYVPILSAMSEGAIPTIN